MEVGKAEVEEGEGGGDEGGGDDDDGRGVSACPERSRYCISRTESIMMPSGVAGFMTAGRSNVTASLGVTEGGSLSTRVWAMPISTWREEGLWRRVAGRAAGLPG